MTIEDEGHELADISHDFEPDETFADRGDLGEGGRAVEHSWYLHEEQVRAEVRLAR
jgi:anti-sigma regulatory factor (Ser/Thr protein kinase)